MCCVDRLNPQPIAVVQLVRKVRVLSDSYRPILLKNSRSQSDEKIICDLTSFGYFRYEEVVQFP